jgi:hypothetical protein
MKVTCTCGEVLSNSEAPNDVQLRVYTDKEWGKNLELPMLAFKMTGIEEKIELTIEEVFGFPNETNHGGGYLAVGNLDICAKGYSVSAKHHFTTGELYRFYLDLSCCYKAMSGTASLENMERELELNCEFNKFGHVNLSGRFQAELNNKNILEFEIRTDQTQVEQTLYTLKHIFDIFGDDKGKKENFKMFGNG